MANPTDNSAHPQPPSGEQAHTQETGEAGLSSKMEHKFCEIYKGSALPVQEKGSCVRPIPKEEGDTYKFPESSEKMPHPSVFGLESHSMHAERGVVKLGGLAVVEENNLPLGFPLRGQLKNRKEEEAVKALPGTRAIAEADGKEVGGESCIMDPKMVTRKKTAKRAPGVPKGGRKRNCYRMRATGNNWKLSCIVGVLLMNFAISNGFSVGTQNPADKNATCFTCKDKKCLDLQKIFKPDDTRLYQRVSNDTFPVCSEIPPPIPTTAETCTVCRTQSIVIIACSADVSKIEAEDSNDPLAIAQECNQQKPSGQEEGGVIPNACPSHEHFGLITVVVGALVIFMIYSV